jgi:phosphomannomutase
MSIYRAYDIRGIYGETLTGRIMGDIGKALGTFMHRRGMGGKVVVGNDVRYSSPGLSKALRKGLSTTGVRVLNAGTTSFGVALFAGMEERAVTAYITASHNPPEWNGVKLFGPDCVGFLEKDNKEVGRLVSEGKFRRGTAQKGRKMDYRDRYKEFMCSRFKISRPLKIVVDCGNGAASIVAPWLFRALGFEAVDLFCEPDPNFPGRGPDVTEESCRCLMEAVTRTGADMGLAFDGDGDRVAMVDEKGKYVHADMMAVALGREMLKAGPGKVVCNVDCSMLMERLLGPLGAEVVRIPVGNTFMMRNVMEHGAVFGSESSHHYVLPSYLPFDDGMVAGLKMAEMLSLSGSPLSSFFDGLSPLPRKAGEFACPDGRKDNVMKGVETALSKQHRVIAIDGVGVSLDDGWGLVRPSNTSPVIRVTAEGETRAAMEDIYSRLSRAVMEAI